MFAYLKGEFTHKSPALLHVEVQGVGYEVNISLNTYEAIQSASSGLIYTWLQIKEDAHVLFGFATLQEKEVFLQLLSVSGVGAATARMMLSYLRPDEVLQAIASGNVKLLESVKGIGKKTAERLILELREKVTKKGQPQTSGIPMALSHLSSVENDAVQALVSLGIARTMAEGAVQKVLKAEPDQTQLELLIKKALKAI